MSINAQKYLVAGLSLVLAGALVAVGAVEAKLRRGEAARASSTSGPLDPQLDKGRQVYEKYSCVACHGSAGAGGINNVNAQTGGKINGLRMVSESYTKQELVKKILDGVPVVEKADPNGPAPPLTMPAYRALLGTQELDDLVNYLFSLGPGTTKSKKEAW